MANREKVLSEKKEYKGRIYIRPTGNGIILLDLPGGPDIMDFVDEQMYSGLGQYAQMHLVVEGFVSQDKAGPEYTDAWNQ